MSTDKAVGSRLPLDLPPPLATRRRMSGRDTQERHRASTPLELLFDLTLVVAVAAAASRLHHGLAESDIGEAALAFAQVFFTIWWAYFLVPFPQVLHQRRERGFLWGYGHAVVFAALAALGGVLEVVADAVSRAPGHAVHQAAVSHASATPLFAISLTAGTIGTVFAALWWLGGQTTRRDARAPVYVIPVLLASLAAVAGVSLGLPLAWGLLLLAGGPALLVAWVMRDRRLQPERFAVR